LDGWLLDVRGAGNAQRRALFAIVNVVERLKECDSLPLAKGVTLMKTRRIRRRGRSSHRSVVLSVVVLSLLVAAGVVALEGREESAAPSAGEQPEAAAAGDPEFAPFALPRPTVAPSSTDAEPPTTVDAAAGWLIFQDPVTGEWIGNPSAADFEALLQSWREREAAASELEATPEIRLSGGGAAMKMPRSLHSALIATVDADGNLRIGHDEVLVGDEPSDFEAEALAAEAAVAQGLAAETAVTQGFVAEEEVP
jgi:hypothetical protein